MDVSERTLNSLGFEEVRAALAARCRTEVGQERARARAFLSTRDEVQSALTLADEARALKNEPITLPITGIADIRTPIDRASKGGMLEPRDLMNVTQVLFSFERSHELLVERRERMPGLAVLGRRLPVLNKLASRLDRSFEASGEISDRASPDLRDARERARGLHRRIRGRLDELLHDANFSENLREGYYSVRNDRYVVPVKSSHQREVDGIVHNASQSGQTLFVEPKEMIGLGNELAIAQSIVLEEERKVLLELSGMVGREAKQLLDGVEALSQLDELEAVASLANDLKATTPTLEPADGALVLKALRHPRLVLKGGEIVSNDVAMGDARALVVSGPNAGGKTVTLTGVGLCALMTRAGLPIPCEEGSRIPLFNQVHSAIGDQQDLQAGLSTFSAHVTMLRDIVSVARRGALVLIDEIAADTDPREGAAIATAVLEELLSRGAIVLVTTHLEELKALAHLDPRFINARVGFDGKRMSPTYRLQIGFAGASSAIEIARRVGLDEAICVRAHELATNTGGALSKALAAADEERRKLWEQRDGAERDARAAKEARELAESELSAAAKKRKEEEVKFREALRAELEFARNQIRSLIEKLETERGDKALKAAQAMSADLTARINEQTVAERGVRQELKGDARDLAPLELKIGARVRHRSMDAEVEIIDLAGDQATVAAGALKMRVPVSELGPATKQKAPPEKKSRVEKAKDVSAQVLTLASPTIDVRGERLEDAMRKVEQFLDRCTRNGDEAAIVIHGHGTGAIKRDLRESLKRSPYAKSFRPGDASEGGDGVTVVLF
jgi:DNA mismatch repair protein MutS2